MQRWIFLCLRTTTTKRGIFPPLVSNFLLNKILKISSWDPSKRFAVIITPFNLLQKNVNTLLWQYAASPPPQSGMCSDTPSYDILLSRNLRFPTENLCWNISSAPCSSEEELPLPPLTTSRAFAEKARGTSARGQTGKNSKGTSVVGLLLL